MEEKKKKTFYLVHEGFKLLYPAPADYSIIKINLSPLKHPERASQQAIVPPLPSPLYATALHYNMHPDTVT